MEYKIMEKKSKSKRMIPHELILLEILPKLPVKSLCRFKSVSKLWNSTISTDPSFLKAQFSHSSSTGLTLLITFQNTYDENNSFVLSAKIKPNNEAETQAQYEFTRPIRYFMSQSLQDLNLIHLKNPESVLIANTATHQFITLPSPGQEEEVRHWDRNSFGFDPVRSQHKVLNIRVIYTDILNNEDEVRLEHRILSLSQSQWRRLNNVPTHIPAPSSKSICIDGFVYYTAMLLDPSSSDDRQYIPDDPRYIIVEFDVSRERFDFIELPPLIDGYCSIWYRLVNYRNGKLGLIKSQVRDRDGNDWDNILSIWILLCQGEGEGEKGRRRRSWVNKKFKIPVDLRKMNGMNDSGFNVAGTVHSTGEVIIMNTGRGTPYHVNLYNLETNCVRKIEISELPKDLNPHDCTVTDVCDHVENLWPLNI